jgi:hypothetical protein
MALLKRDFSFVNALGICFVVLVIVDSILVYILGKVNG